jgi:hypothetical protein
LPNFFDGGRNDCNQYQHRVNHGAGKHEESFR